MFGQNQLVDTSAPSFSETVGEEMAWLKAGGAKIEFLYYLASAF